MPTINHSQLRSLLEDVKGTMFLSVQLFSNRGRSVKVPVFIRQTLVGMTGFDYQNAVRNAFLREGKQIDETKFGTRPWGVMNKNRTMITHTNSKGEYNEYLRIRTMTVLKNAESFWVDENGILVPKATREYYIAGEQVSYEIAKPHLSTSKPSAVQEGLDTIVKENEVRFDHIEYCRIRGIDYKVVAV